MPGNAVGLDDRSVAEAIGASRAWWAEEDIPDPLGRLDIRARPDLAAAALRRRHEDGWVFGEPRSMDYPKPNGRPRKMTRLDPIADPGYRRLVGRVVGPIEKSLGDKV